MVIGSENFRSFHKTNAQKEPRFSLHHTTPISTAQIFTFFKNLIIKAPNSDKAPLTLKEAILKASRYCAYQERCQKQVREKLYSYGITSDEVEEALSELITQGFINEERFAKSYTRGKFNYKKWGKIKIEYGLKALDISTYCIKQGLKEIGEDQYNETLYRLAQQKFDSCRGKSLLERAGKTKQYLGSKGYEFDKINNVLSDLLHNEKE